MEYTRISDQIAILFQIAELAYILNQKRPQSITLLSKTKIPPRGRLINTK